MQTFELRVYKLRAKNDPHTFNKFSAQVKGRGGRKSK